MMQAQGRVVRTRLLGGPAAPLIAQTAVEEAADVIAMATHGRGGLARLLLGSVATVTLQHVATPMLVVRPSSMRQAVATS
jgi:nucleotide-binding universal stress UspA family protein